MTDDLEAAHDLAERIGMLSEGDGRHLSPAELEARARAILGSPGWARWQSWVCRESELRRSGQTGQIDLLHTRTAKPNTRGA